MRKAFSPPALKGLRARTSFRAPKGMIETLAQHFKENNISIKKRSAWISAATEALLARPDCCDIVAEEFMDYGNSEQIPLTITEDLLCSTDRMAEVISVELNEQIERSSIIRAAITQKILIDSGRAINPLAGRS